MWQYMLALAVVGQVLGHGYAHADSRTRLEALLGSLEVTAGRFEKAGPREAERMLPLRDTGDAAETLFCLTFNRRETKQMLNVRHGHAYVCFNFLQNPSEAVGNVLDKRGRQRCLITGFFGQGTTVEDDCLVLALCGSVFVAGACSP
ncbi:MAG: hypothetical protein LUO96_06750 [Methanomicrobiales archaeon]|nr:hypothetical protein [Methanomicrobiales archaeon]